jgi:hypothetical protein
MRFFEKAFDPPIMDWASPDISIATAVPTRIAGG